MNTSFYTSDQLHAELLKKIDQLPQRDVIEMDDINQWVKYMLHVMPNEALWHVTRLTGIGGSEVGALVKNFLGHPADFMFSAHDWAELKLLRRHPEPSGGALKRGHDIEPIHRSYFHSMYSMSRDNLAYNTLNQSHAKERPWLRYSADDLVVVTKPVMVDFDEDILEIEKGRFLIDYKSPTTISKNLPFQYACQLHQGAIIAEDSGIDLSATILSQWDWQNWKPHNQLVPISHELKDLIKRAGDYYWDMVLNGQVPSRIYSKQFKLDPKVREDWTETVHYLGMLNALKTQIEKQATDVRKEIETALQLDQHRLQSQKIEFKDVLRISAVSGIDEEKILKALSPEEIEEVSVKDSRTRYDTPALVRHAKEVGIDVSQFRIPTRIDPEKSLSKLAEKGLNPDEFISESIRFTTDKTLAAQANLWVSENLPAPSLPSMDDRLIPEPTEDSAALTVELHQNEDASPAYPSPSP